MKKELAIKEFLESPIKVGDNIMVTGISSKMEQVEVFKVDDEFLYWKLYHYTGQMPLADVKSDIRVTTHLGSNPFKKYTKMTSYAIDIWQLFYRFGYEEKDGVWVKKQDSFDDILIDVATFDPVVTDHEGKDVPFQRGLVWSLEQKQLLIDAVFNRIEIGKFVLRPKNRKWIANRIKLGKLKHTAYNDIIDGKQRFHALLDFVNNQISTTDGIKWEDLSIRCRGEFQRSSNLSYVRLDEDSTDDEALSTFMGINHTGVPMSKEHIEFVKSIKIK